MGRMLSQFLQVVCTLLGVTLLTFGLTYLAPGDPAELMLTSMGSQIIPPELLAQTRAELGLDQPFIVQYGLWLWHAIQGDLGVSYATHQPVWNMLWDGFKGTIWITLGGLLIQVLISLPLGMFAAVHHDGWQDTWVRNYSMATISIPSYALGILFLYIFAMKLHLFPVAKSVVSFQTIVLPAVTLGIGLSAKFTRQVRTVVMDEIHQDYVVGARARGMSDKAILWKQILPNSLMPLITIIGMSFGWLLAGAAIVEIVFSYPGMGRMAVQAIAARDYPFITGYVLWVAVFYMGINYTVDTLYHYIDPRQRRAER